MSKRARRNHSPAFKAKVALAAVRGEKLLAEPIEAPEEALARNRKRAIFNSDQGSQFTSAAFTPVLDRERSPSAE